MYIPRTSPRPPAFPLPDRSPSKLCFPSRTRRSHPSHHSADHFFGPGPAILWRALEDSVRLDHERRQKAVVGDQHECDRGGGAGVAEKTLPGDGRADPQAVNRRQVGEESLGGHGRRRCRRGVQEGVRRGVQEVVGGGVPGEQEGPPVEPSEDLAAGGRRGQKTVSCGRGRGVLTENGGYCCR